MKKKLSRNEKLLILHGIQNGTKTVDDLIHHDPVFNITLSLNADEAENKRLQEEIKALHAKGQEAYYITLNLNN